MAFPLPGWYFLPLLALLPLIYRRTKAKISSAPVTTISLARYRLLAQIMQQRKVAGGPTKPPVLIFIAAALAILAAAQPTPSVPGPGHGIALVVGVEAGNSMNFPGGPDVGGEPRLVYVKDAAKKVFAALGPGDPSSLILHDSRIAFSVPLGLPSSVSVNTLDSLATGFGGNKPASAIVEAMRLLSDAPPTFRRVAVFFNDGTGLGEENIASVLASAKDLSAAGPVEGYFVFSSSDPTERAALATQAASIGWTVVNYKDWSPAQVISGPPTVSGESLLPMASFIALGAFALLAFALLRDVRRA